MVRVVFLHLPEVLLVIGHVRVSPEEERQHYGNENHLTGIIKHIKASLKHEYEHNKFET